MPLGAELSQLFSKVATPYINSASSIRETDLFDHLISSLISLPDYIVGRIHGNKSMVTFPDDCGWFTKQPRCELGDVCIIAYSKRRRKARLIIMQNKVARTPRGVLAIDGSQINASLVQYNLLSFRPCFEYVKEFKKTKRFNNGLIRSSPYPSVCVYGNFCINSKNEADMYCVTANAFNYSPSRIPLRSKYPSAKIRYTGLYEDLSTRNGSGDFVAANNLLDFGDLLEDLYIGKPIDASEQADILKLIKTAFHTNPDKASDDFLSVLRDFETTDLIQSEIFSERSDASFREDYDRPISNYSGPHLFCRDLVLLNVDYLESSASLGQPQYLYEKEQLRMSGRTINGLSQEAFYQGYESERLTE